MRGFSSPLFSGLAPILVGCLLQDPPNHLASNCLVVSLVRVSAFLSTGNTPRHPILVVVYWIRSTSYTQSTIGANIYGKVEEGKGKM